MTDVTNNVNQIFCLSFNYWKIVKQRGTTLTDLEVFIVTLYLFGFLITAWQKR